MRITLFVRQTVEASQSSVLFNRLVVVVVVVIIVIIIIIVLIYLSCLQKSIERKSTN
jgi:formate hydrogenlyase subunit 4